MAVTKLVPGFRFHPTGVELIKYFLKRKVLGKKFHDDVIAEIDIYKYAPWDLPDKSCLKTGDLEWYFFCPIEKKYGSGMRMNRATEIGFWKATGKDRAVQQNNQTVGMIKTLIFHMGKAPRGDRTNWVIHEYRLEDKDLADKGIPQDSYVICKVFQKEGPGPKNGAQYGRPFNEEDWNDENWNDGVGIPFAESAALAPILPVTSNSAVPNDQNLHASGCSHATSMSCLSDLMPSPGPANPSHPSNQALNDDGGPILPLTSNSSVPNDQNLHASGCSRATSMSCLSELMPSPGPANPSHASNQALNDDDGDILSMLDIFKEDDTLPKEDDIPGQANIAAGLPSSDFFEGLGDLDYWAVFGGLSTSQNAEFSTNGMVTTGDVLGCDWDGLSTSQNADFTTNGMVTTSDVLRCDLDFLEMNDLDPPLFWQTTQPGSWSQDK